MSNLWLEARDNRNYCPNLSFPHWAVCSSEIIFNLPYLDEAVAVHAVPGGRDGLVIPRGRAASGFTCKDRKKHFIDGAPRIIYSLVENVFPSDSNHRSQRGSRRHDVNKKIMKMENILMKLLQIAKNRNAIWRICLTRIEKCGTLHDFACHPCAGAMLIFSVSFQF